MPSPSSFDPTRDYDQEAKDARIDSANDSYSSIRNATHEINSTYEVLETIKFGADATTPDTGQQTEEKA